jgi:tetratricopeptide (TPR) repeat protein
MAGDGSGHRLVGRARPLGELEAALRAAVAGRGALALVTGEAGIGKSRLAAELAAKAASVGARVVWASCWDGGGAPAYWPWVQALRAAAAGRDPVELAADLGLGAGEVLRLAPELAGLLPAPPPEPPRLEPEQARFRLFDAVASYLRASAARVPLLLVVDDLHWADVPSLLLLRFLARDLRDSRILLLATYRDPELDPHDPVAELVADLAGKALRLPLAGLTGDEVGALVADATGAAADPATVAALHRRSGGNPLFAAELARLLATQGRLAGAGPGRPAGDLAGAAVPDTVRAVLGRRLARLDPDCRDLLRLAAVAGVRFGVELLARAAGRDRAEVLRLLAEAETGRLVAAVPGGVDGWAFTHTLVRDVLYEGLGAADRPGAHLRAAEALLALHGDDERQLAELAHHFLHAAGLDGGRAVAYASRAGRRALRLLAYEEAAGLFEQALAALPAGGRDEGQRVELLLALGDARLRAGAFEVARDAYEQAAALARRRGRPAELATAALGFAAGLGFEVRLYDHRQVELLEEALAALPAGDSSLRAWALARLSVALSYVASAERRQQLAAEAVAMARRLGDRAALASALSSACDAVAGPEHTEQRLASASEMVALAAADGDPELELLGRRFRVVALLELGDLAAAEREVAAYARGTGRLLQPTSAWYVPLWRGMFALLRGRLEAAERLVEEAEAIGARAASGNAAILCPLQRWMLHRERGDPVRALAAMERVVQLAPVTASARTGLAWSLLEAGRPVEARAELEWLVADGCAALERDAEWLPATMALAHVAAALPHPDAAQTLYRLLAPHARRFTVEGIGAGTHGSLARQLGLLAGALGRREEAVAHFEAALTANGAAGSPLLVAHTRGDYGAALLRLGGPADRERAAALLAEAAAAYRELGLTVHAERAEALAGRPAGAGGGARLRREGDHWMVAWAGRSVHLRHGKGVDDLASLLAAPGRAFHVLDLVGAAGEGGGDEVLDRRARGAYRARAEELREDIEQAQRDHDPERATRARVELEAIADELGAGVGLGGRARRLGDPAERARKTVSWRLRSTLDRIDRAHPDLGRHLRQSLRMGTFCSYQPDPPVRWDVG